MAEASTVLLDDRSSEVVVVDDDRGHRCRVDGVDVGAPTVAVSGPASAEEASVELGRSFHVVVR